MLRFLERLTDDGDSRIGVLVMSFGTVDQRGVVQAFHGFLKRRTRTVKVVAYRRFTHQPRAMRHKLSQRDGLVGRIVRMKVRQVTADRRIEVQLSAFDQLHDADVGEQL